jgi:acetyl esterase/lipase
MNTTIRTLKQKYLIPTLLLLCAIPTSAQQTPPPPPQIPPPDTISIQQDIEYATPGSEKLLLDIYLPAGKATRPRPAVILIHGGGWSALDKSTMRTMANFLARSGMVAVSVNYRLFDGTDANRWPAQLDDVQRAVRWLRSNAAKYNIDPDHIGAFGHSSGAQLAALLGMEETRDNSDASLAKYSSKVQAVVDVSGPTDFLTNRDADGTAALTNFFGGDVAKLPDVWRSASPVFQVTKSSAPFLIMHGTSDEMIPIAQAQELTDKLQQAGVPVTFLKFDDAHTFISPENRRRLALESLSFYTRYLAPNH